MPLKFNENTGQYEVVGKRGRHKGSGQPDPAQKALTNSPKVPESGLPSGLFRKKEPTTLRDVLMATIESISGILRNGGYDENVANALRRKGYDPDKVLDNPGLYSNILTSLQDELMQQAGRNAEDMGEFGGMGSVGEDTVSKATWGKRVKK